MDFQVKKWIKDYVNEYKIVKNTETEWREPVIAIADAHNLMFSELKEVVCPTHVLPQDLLDNAQSVIVFFLPFEKDIIKSNIGGQESSRAWDIANIETNNLILDINKHLYDRFNSLGYRSTIMPATYNYDEKLLASDWSHRHVGQIAGLGTFGLNGLLITEKGCCGRIGSVVTDMVLTPTEKPLVDKCLFKYNGSCGNCINKCVAKAFQGCDEEIHLDRRMCNDQIYNDCVPEYPIGLGDACGKCMSGVPCSYFDPVEAVLSVSSDHQAGT